ncbi:hypothetical protein [Prolixibacter sp. SD074]|jgi:hypothetical protein|uniref:hypothetical protein n=1 Tax=Prolixibacter sp. SD074 TaxID=2652391 RepID=UPI001298FB65|nr:hypothetical protein [Prolixibacter sp. SD074]
MKGQNTRKRYLLIAGLYVITAVLLKFIIVHINFFSNVSFTSFLPLITLVPILYYFSVGTGLLGEKIKNVVVLTFAALLSQLFWADLYDVDFLYKELIVLLGGVLCRFGP